MEVVDPEVVSCANFPGVEVAVLCYNTSWQLCHPMALAASNLVKLCFFACVFIGAIGETLIFFASFLWFFLRPQHLDPPSARS